MQFDNLADFLQMSGHGVYVWSAYIIVTITIVYLVWSPLARKRRIITEQQRRLRREEYEARQKAGSSTSI